MNIINPLEYIRAGICIARVWVVPFEERGLSLVSLVLRQLGSCMPSGVWDFATVLQKRMLVSMLGKGATITNVNSIPNCYTRSDEGVDNFSLSLKLSSCIKRRQIRAVIVSRLYLVAAKELHLRYYVGETILITRCTRLRACRVSG